MIVAGQQLLAPPTQINNYGGWETSDRKSSFLPGIEFRVPPHSKQRKRDTQ